MQLSLPGYSQNCTTDGQELQGFPDMNQASHHANNSINLPFFKKKGSENDVPVTAAFGLSVHLC